MIVMYRNRNLWKIHSAKGNQDRRESRTKILGNQETDHQKIELKRFVVNLKKLYFPNAVFLIFLLFVRRPCCQSLSG